MFLKTGSAHPELEKVCSKLDHINTKDMEVEMAEVFDPTRFLPESKTFYTYPGSLTTPPLFEVSLKTTKKSPKLRIRVSTSFFNFLCPNLPLCINGFSM